MKPRGLLLDRDGVINIDRGYVGRRDQFEFMPNLFPFLRAAQDLGFRLAVLTNQSGVARGLYGEKDFENLSGWMKTVLADEGIALDLILAAFEQKDSKIPAYARESYWRKPNPGMVLEATQRMAIDPARSAFLGDNLRDMEAGKAGHIGLNLLLAEPSASLEAYITPVADFTAALESLASFRARPPEPRVG